MGAASRVSLADQQIASPVLRGTHHTPQRKRCSQGCAKLCRETTFYLFSIACHSKNQPGTWAGPVLETHGGNSLFSPSTNVQIFTPVQTQTNVDPVTITKDVSKSVNVLGSLDSFIH